MSAFHGWAEAHEDHLRRHDMIHECQGFGCHREVWPDEGHDIGGRVYCDSCAEDILMDRASGLAVDAFGPDAEVLLQQPDGDLVHHQAIVNGVHLIRPPLSDSPAAALDALIVALQHEIAEQRRREARKA